MDFTRKARWVLDGHKTPDPVGSKYAGVVSRESVRIAFTYAALNDLDVCMADIRNAYLQSPTSQKHYIICGPEFGMAYFSKAFGYQVFGGVIGVPHLLSMSSSNTSLFLISTGL